ncbi:MAG: hypothetical protein VCA73_20870 [Roseibacillus sp.]
MATLRPLKLRERLEEGAATGPVVVLALAPGEGLITASSGPGGTERHLSFVPTIILQFDIATP